MKKILIIGPISDFGGREIEVKYIIQNYQRKYDVTLLSTISMSEFSVALPKDKIKWSTLDKKICKEYFIIKLFGILAKIKNGRKGVTENFILNNFSRKLFNFEKIKLKIIENEIKQYDVILFSGELTSKWLDKVIIFSTQYKKKSILRTTGTVTNIPEQILPILHNLNYILVHSNSNYKKIYPHSPLNLKILDQTAIFEKELLDIVIKKSVSKELVFGYLGRFGSEKGILELLNFFEKNKKRILIAGSGYLLDNVLKSSEKHENINYVGELSDFDVVRFFNLIDVLIIPSLEEAGPLVGIEGMAAGKIIISTKVGAMEDRMKSIGKMFWFQIENEESLNYHIRVLETLSEDELFKMKNKYRDSYNLNFSNEIINKGYMDLIS